MAMGQRFMGQNHNGQAGPNTDKHVVTLVLDGPVGSGKFTKMVSRICRWALRNKYAITVTTHPQKED